MFSTLKKLITAKLLTPGGLLALSSALRAEGQNLMALLRFAAQMHSEHIALTDGCDKLTYRELYARAAAVAAELTGRYQVAQGSRVALLGGNSTGMAVLIFAVAATGADLYLLNAEASAEQIRSITEQFGFGLVVYDDDGENKTVLCSAGHTKGATIRQLLTMPSEPLRRKSEGKRSPGGSIVVLTGGTTGVRKAASRTPSVTAFLSPFLALTRALHIEPNDPVLIATPLYHGYGLAALLFSVALGSKIYLPQNWNTGQAARLIAAGEVSTVTLVPVQLQRLLVQKSSCLPALRNIICGGAALPQAAVNECTRLGARLFNIYGTSEAGIALMATPEDLAAQPGSIGRKIPGVALRIAASDGRALPAGEKGRIEVRSSWTAKNNAAWINTGDMGYMNAGGYCFLCGRADDMIVSGGENVYPAELEDVIARHPKVAHAAAVGIPDAEFGARLALFIEPALGCTLDAAELKTWYAGRLARYQAPKYIEFMNMTFTPLGKPDKRALRAFAAEKWAE